MASLFVIATPIGNRKDITLRALETMFSVDVLLCEDTRKTRQLLDFYRQEFPTLPSYENIHTSRHPQLVSFFEHNEEKRIGEVLDYLEQGLNVGLVTNAGTPTISDPGFKLIKVCREEEKEVVSIPGPSALIAALSVSGLSADKVTYLGFMARA